MKSVAKIIAYLLAVVFLGALLAPLLFWMVHSLEPWALANGYLKFEPVKDQIEVSGPLAFMASDFEKYFTRSVLVAAIALLMPAKRWLESDGTGKKGLGLYPDPRRWQHLLFGLGIGGGLVALMATAYVFLDFYHFKDPLPWGQLPKLLLSAAVVGYLEEWIFRGAIMGLFLRASKPMTALFWTTLIFAVLHFLKPAEQSINPEQVTWLTGFSMLPLVFHQFAEPTLLLAGLPTLFVLGWLVGYARLQTSALWVSIGIHAGVVFVKMGFAKFTKRDLVELPWVGPELQIGLVPVAVLLFGLFLVWRRLKYEELLPAPRKRA